MHICMCIDFISPKRNTNKEHMDLESVMVSQAKFLKGDQESYKKFQDVLNRLRTRKIYSSTAAVSVYKFLDHRQYSNVLHALKPFLPNSYSDNPDFRECLSFLKRLAAQYPGEDGIYTKFLDFMDAHSRKELTLSEVCTKVVRLLDKDQELAVEFSSLLPDLKRRRLSHQDDDDQEIHAPPKRPRIFTKEESIDFDMEEELSKYEVKIGQVESTYEVAEELWRSVISCGLSPENIRVDEHFSTLDLSCIRNTYRQIMVNDEIIQFEELPELIQRLMMKKEILEKSRAELIEKWIRIRQSRTRK